jgi:hypothetical protein
MVQFQAPNIYGAFTQGMADGRNRLRNDMQDAETARLGQARNALSQAIQSGGADSDGARNALAMLDPGSAMTMQRDDARNTRNFDRGVFESDRGFAFQQQGRQIQQANATAAQSRSAASAQATATTDAQNAKNQMGAAILRQVLQSGDPASAWPRALEIARQRGLDLNGIPTEYPGDDAVAMFQAELSGNPMDMRGATVADPLAKARALANEAGLTPGTDEYRNFVLQQAGRAPGMSLTTNPDGGVSLTMGGGPGGGQPLNVSEGLGVSLLNRMRASSGLVDKGESVLAEYSDTLKSKFPVVGNSMVSEEFQRANQAGREWAMAILRKDTGAAMTVSEEQMMAEVYLPQPGDLPPVLAQKRESRRNAMDGIAAGLGTAQVIERDLARARAVRQAGGDDSGDTSKVPPGVDPEVWKFISEEDRKLWSK